MDIETIKHHKKIYYNSLLKERFNKHFNLDIYRSVEYQKAYQKEYQKLNRQKYRDSAKNHYERYKEEIREKRYHKTSLYKLKLELTRCDPLVDDFYDEDFIIKLD